MLGTIVNTIAVFLGALLGLIIKGGLRERFKEIILQGLGMAIFFIGASGTIGGLLKPEAHPILFIISLVIGGLIGEAFGIEEKLNSLGDLLQSKFGKNDSNLSKAFVSTSLIYCVGTMAILGSIESGITGTHNILFAKSVLDGVSAIIFASTLGIGVLLSAVSVFIYQGALTLLAVVIEPYMTENMIREISIVGGILITALSLDMLDIRKMKVGNLLPAVVIPVIYYLLFSKN